MRERLFHEELFHQLVAGNRKSFVDLELVFFHLGLEAFGDSRVGSVAGFIEFEGLIRYEVDKAHIGSTFVEGYEHRADDGAEGFTELSNDLFELCVLVVHFIDKECLGQLFCIIPGKLCTDLQTGLTVNNDDGASGDRNSLLDLADEVEIAGGIENIDLLAVPDKIHKRCGDRAVFFYFFGVEIADRVAVCDLT